jgi:peroxiredoxin
MSNINRSIIIIGTILVSIAVTGYACKIDQKPPPVKTSQNTQSPDSTYDIDNGPRPYVGMKAWDFTLNNLDGNPVRFSDLKGKTIMLDFWIYACSGCREKIGVIQETFSKLPTDKYAVLCINVKESQAVIRAFSSAEKITVPILFDVDGSVSQMYKINGFPTTYIIDPNEAFQKIDIMFSTAEELRNIILDLNK